MNSSPFLARLSTDYLGTVNFHDNVLPLEELAGAAYAAFRDIDGGDYEVPTGFKMIVSGLKFWQRSTTNSMDQARFGYSDNAGSTNFVNLLPFICANPSNVIGHVMINCTFEIPAGKFPVIQSTNGDTTSNGELYYRLEAV